MTTLSNSPAPSNNLDAALTLASQGFAVFPVWWVAASGQCACGVAHPDGKSVGKHPITPSGHNDASLDPAMIAEWWRIAPTANVGVAVPDGFAVVDVDPRNGGEATFGELQARGLPTTRTASTGGGGLHLWYRLTPGLALPSTLGAGVDVKQLGGYVLAPPSNHASGGVYAWLNDATFAEAPAWLVALGRPRGESTTVVVDEDEGPSLPAAEVERVAALLEPHFAEGKKHHMAFALGGWLRGRGWNSSDVAHVLERLPSRDPRARVKDAIDGYRASAAHGWHALRELVGEPAADALDRATPNPKYQRELEARVAAQDLIPAMAASAVQVAPVPQVPAQSSIGMLDRLRRLQQQGPPRATGMAPLDKALRGGLRDEKILVFGGAPGAGKTTLARQVADHMSRTGVAVGWLASDEEPTAIDARRLQAIGVPRHVAEQPDEATIARAARELEPLPFIVYDGAEGWSIERVFADLAQRFPTAARCVVADSLQTVRTDRTATLDSMRARIDDVLATAKALCRAATTRSMVIFTSELARGSYRSEASADATNDLAAFKESGGIEYQAHTLLVLRSVKGEGQFVEVTMPKNRLGPKLDFTLKLNLETAELTESFDDPRAAQLTVAADAVIPDVARVLAGASWPGLSGRAVEQAAGRKAEVVRAALRLMAERGLAHMNPGPRNALCWMPGPPLGGHSAAANDGRSHAPPRLAQREPSLEESQNDLAQALATQREALGK